ncbi:MAG: peptide deformylase, partial [Pikeienuella sp.]
MGPRGGAVPRAFLRWPDARLKAVALAVPEVDAQVREIWRELVAAMRQVPGGVGLAAPQLGIGLRLAVVDATGTGLRPLKLANPELLWASAEMRSWREGSPNLPGVSEEVSRPAAVRIRYIDAEGGGQEQFVDGGSAGSGPHQIDPHD